MAKKKKVSYLGNPLLKKSGVPIEFEAWQVAEIMKCAGDPEYFIEKYVKIVSLDLGIINFNLWDYQKKIVRASQDNRFVICKLPRQAGKTTTIAGIMLHASLFNDNYTIAILAHKHEQSREILNRIQFAYEQLPMWLQQGVIEWNKGSIELENGSRILTSATNAAAIRGKSINLVYLDEFAHVPTNIQEEFFASVYPTISSGKTTKVLITSTPKGLNLFYKLWVDSVEGRNSYVRISVHWSEQPGRDEAWRLETIRNTSEEQFNEEFNCEFLGSSHTLISAAKLAQLVFVTPVTEDKHLKVYHQPVKGSAYAIVVDTSRGGGGDYSAFTVVDITKAPYRLVATYRNNNMLALLYPNVIYNIARHYNEAAVLIETNDIGQQVADILWRDLGYENVVNTGTNKRGTITMTGGFVKTSKRGIRTTTSVKKIGCALLKTLIESDKLIVEDYQTIYELSRFAEKGKSFEAEEGHDDLVMCLVLFAWMSGQPLFKEMSRVDMRTSIFDDYSEQMSNNLVPFGIISTGKEEVVTPDEPSTVPSLEKWLMG